MTKDRIRGARLKDSKRIQCYTSPTVMEWVNKVVESRGWPKAHIGNQALRWYLPCYFYVPTWISIEELLSGPTIENRNRCLVEGYADSDYLEWLSTLSKSAETYLVDTSVENREKIKNIFGYRLKQRRGLSLELDRALKMYYKMAQVNPEILNISVEGVRPEGYEYSTENFKDNDYLVASGAKIMSVLGIDLAKPPKHINLFTGEL